jgi:hypothetical protein
LLSRFAKPLYGLRQIFWQALATIRQAEFALGGGIACIRFGAKLGQRLAVGFALPGVKRLPGQYQTQANTKQQSAKIHNHFLFAFANRELMQSWS